MLCIVCVTRSQESDEGQPHASRKPAAVMPGQIPDHQPSAAVPEPVPVQALPSVPVEPAPANTPAATDANGAALEVPLPQPIETAIVAPHQKEVVPPGPVDIFFDVKNGTLMEGGNALRVVIDNRPPVTLYNSIRPLTLKDLRDGGHTIRAYIAKPDGTMLREAKAFAMTHFYVRKKDFQNYTDPAAPFLTVNLPSGESMDTDADGRVCFDYEVRNAPAATGPGVEYKVRYALEGYEGYLAEPGPVFWSNIPVGKHRLVVELFDKNGQPLFGIFNRVERVFEVRQLLKARPFVPGETVPEAPPQG